MTFTQVLCLSTRFEVFGENVLMHLSKEKYCTFNLKDLNTSSTTGFINAEFCIRDDIYTFWASRLKHLHKKMRLNKAGTEVLQASGAPLEG